MNMQISLNMQIKLNKWLPYLVQNMHIYIYSNVTFVQENDRKSHVDPIFTGFPYLREYGPYRLDFLSQIIQIHIPIHCNTDVLSFKLPDPNF